MKTAVSIPNDVFHRADELAKRLGISRSELYARALANLLASEDDDITAKLDELYRDQPSHLDPSIRAAQSRAVGASDW